MAVLQTQKISICALKSSRKQILEELQRTGIVQIEEGGQEDEVFRKTDTLQARNQFEKEARNADSALKVLDEYAPVKKGMLSSLEGKEPITAGQYYENGKKYKDTLTVVMKILAQERRIAEAEAAKTRCEATIESLVPWMSLDIPVNCRGTETTTVLLGSIPGEISLDEIMRQVAEEKPELDDYSLEVISQSQEQTCLFAVAPKAQAGSLEEALRLIGFVAPNFTTDRTPAEYAEEMRQEAAGQEEAKQAAINEVKSLAAERENIQFVADYQRMRANKYEVLGGLLQSEHAFFLTGYVPSNVSGALKKKLESEYTCDVEIEEVPADEEAPVLLHNNPISAPTETVVESYGLPMKGEIDPTVIMSVFYYIFFGMMLSDAGYGLLMVLGTGFVLWRYKNMSTGMHKMIQMFFWCGVSTTFWGILFGGYFGDVVTVVAQTFFHVEVTIPAVWFTPLDNPIKLLMFCFLFGVIHLFVGLGIKGYLLLREKNYMSFFANVVCWYALLVGLLIILVQSEIFASMNGSAFSFPPIVGTIAKWAAIIGAVCIVIFSEADNKNPVARFALGAYDLYGISSWLSDVLSYSRLMALGLATGVIASVINTMGGMVGGGVIGAILFTLIFLIGHALNMAINVLGAYVHTNRLQYVEFFGKFYEGGGKAFKPFSASDNKYFKFKEEESNG